MLYKAPNKSFYSPRRANLVKEIVLPLELKLKLPLGVRLK